MAFGSKKPLNLYSFDMKLAATIYVKATSAREAMRQAQGFAGEGGCFEFEGGDVSGRTYRDPMLPMISLSPTMTGKGLYPGAAELCEENVTHEGEWN